MDNKLINNKKNFWFYLQQMFKNKQVLVSFFATMSLLILFRVGATITIPGIKISNAIDSNSSFLGILNLLGGGGTTNLSFMAVGVSPYITAQIIIQLLSTDLIKPLAALNKAGERGKKKLEVITRLLTIPFAIMQAYAVLALTSASAQQTGTTFFGQNNINLIKGYQLFFLLIGMVAGTFLTLFIGDIISKRGVGNGITLIILVGIVSSLYSNFSTVFQVLTHNPTISNDLLKYFSFIMYLVFFILILLATTFMNGAVRKIPIQQIGQGLSTNVDEMPYLPIKLNAAGVIPVIFASSIMTIPPTIAQFLNPNSNSAYIINNYLAIEKPVGLSMYAFLILVFGFFYAHIQVNSEKLAENFQKSGKFIPGVKMGEETQKYISKVLNRISFIGVPFLMFIAIIPYIVSSATGIPSGLALGGTGIIIMVTGALDFWSSLKSSQTNYTYSNLTKGLKQSNELAIKQGVETDNVKRLW